MSSTNKTTHLKLHSWVPTDPVLREDFNENFNKIDKAISDIRACYGVCDIYTGYYTGTGETEVSLTFPHAPVILFVRKPGLKATDYYSGFVMNGGYFKGYDGSAKIAVNGRTLTLSWGSTEKIINNADLVYYYIALAPTDGTVFSLT